MGRVHLLRNTGVVSYGDYSFERFVAKRGSGRGLSFVSIGSRAYISRKAFGELGEPGSVAFLADVGRKAILLATGDGADIPVSRPRRGTSSSFTAPIEARRQLLPGRYLHRGEGVFVHESVSG